MTTVRVPERSRIKLRRVCEEATRKLAAVEDEICHELRQDYSQELGKVRAGINFAMSVADSANAIEIVDIQAGLQMLTDAEWDALRMKMQKDCIELNQSLPAHDPRKIKPKQIDRKIKKRRDACDERLGELPYHAIFDHLGAVASSIVVTSPLAKYLSTDTYVDSRER